MRLILVLLLFNCIQAFEFSDQWILNQKQPDGKVYFEGEKHLKNIKQLTFGGANAEAYFSFDNKKITFQASNGPYNTRCDQIYEMDLTLEPGQQIPRRISNGIGATTCSFFLSDNKRRIFAGTFLGNQLSKKWEPSCPMKQCDKNNPKLKDHDELAKLCNRTDLYIWNIFPDYDIFLANEYGNIIKQLTNSPGYDAEGVLSPDGKQILFTSKRDNDLNLYLMDLDGNNVQQLTKEVGYDGGGFFSPDGKKIVWRASRPKSQEELDLYKSLLKYDMVQPIKMELYTMDLATRKVRQITNLNGASWAPYYLSDNKRIIFSSDFNETAAGFGAFSLYVINEDGTGLEQVTHAKGFFDSFPMMSYDGKKLIWGSSRNSSKYDINLFIADWTDDEDSGSGGRLCFLGIIFPIFLLFQ